MAPPKGNRFWTLRSKHGRDKLFASPELLWQAACEYFEWVENNPLHEARLFANKGEIISAKLPKMRAMTMDGLCFYLRCSQSYFRVFKLRHEDDEDSYKVIINDIEAVIRTQKFEGAAADLLNANIIARDLGMTDKQSLDVNYDFENMSEAELIKFGNAIFKKRDNEE
jgi:hypothetical protein